MFLNKPTAANVLSKKREGGIASLEFMIIFPVLILLIAFPLFYARVCMYYSVAQKAAHNSAIYLAKLPLMEMQDIGKSIAATALTQDIVNSTIGELQAGSEGVILTQINCDGGPCGSGVPDNITVHVRVRMFDEFFDFFTRPFVGDEGVHVKAKVTMRYIGA